MSTRDPLQPGLFIDGRGRVCELREVGGTWQHPSTTTEPQCLTYPPERLIPESRLAAIEADIRALAAKWEAVAQTRPVANIGCPGGPGDYARDIQYRADALRALVGDETPGTGEGA